MTEKRCDYSHGAVILYQTEHIIGLYDLLDETITDLANIRDDKYNAKSLDAIIERFHDVLVGNDYYVHKAEAERESE